MSSEDILLSLSHVSKRYPLSHRPLRHLWNQLLGRSSPAGCITALHPISLELRRGESLGIVGLNGAGKSTLLQIASDVLTPSSGRARIQGRVAALLELGSGLNPEASGLENIYLYAAILGLPQQLIENRIEAIISFSGLQEAIHKPVKAYSSGMQVRLAFSIATSVDPDLLIVDEALSVGDGIFAKRSFERLMQLRDRGTSLLFCSHALFHIDLFCQRCIWLDQGRVRAEGATAEVLTSYQEFLDSNTNTQKPSRINSGWHDSTSRPDVAQLLRATVKLDGRTGKRLTGSTQASRLDLELEIQVSREEPQPRAALVISSESGRILGTTIAPAGLVQATDEQGRCRIHFCLRQLPLNRGVYRVGVYLLCQQARYVYAWSDPHTLLDINHEGSHQGPWIVNGQWDQT